MNVDGTWTVPLVFGEKTIDTVWINEYGMWRIKSTGGLTGNKAAMNEKTSSDKSEKQDEKNLRADYSWEAFANYMYLGLGDSAPRGSAFAFSIDVRTSNVRYGGQLVSDFGKFGIVQAFAGYGGAIKLGGKAAIIPYGDVGIGIAWFEKDAPKSYDPFYNETTFDPFTQMSLGFLLSGGIMFRTAAVPGLSVRAAYQFNFYDPLDILKRINPLPGMTHCILVGVGYAFN
jgi:hypothetical protein